MIDDRIAVFSTCPPSTGASPRDYLDEVVHVARWSERAGCRGILVYSDNSLVDAWLVAKTIVEHTSSLAPLVAVQPVYMHPYAVAKMVASIAFLHGRRIYLNMVAGGFKTDLAALRDDTPHDLRYRRLTEYTTIISRLLEGTAPVTLEGEYYRVENLKMSPPLPAGLFPGIFVSGSSEAGVSAARAIGATAIEYPKPTPDYAAAAVPEDGLARGIRIGLIARQAGQEAWDLARARFPEDRRGRLTHALAMKVSDSVWHRQLSAMEDGGGADPYWLVPFRNYKTMCPYLVGSYDRVGEELGRYASLGYRTFILDVPRDPEELDHVRIAFDRALERCPSPSQIG